MRKTDDKEYIELEPIISKSVEIRDLAIFINNTEAINEMEKIEVFQEVY